MKRVPSATLLLAALALFLVGCSDSKPTVAAGALTASASTLPPPQPAPEFFTASGPLVVENQIDVASEREGVVAKVMAEPGLRVKKGQLLAQLDDRQLSADLEAARAKTGSAEADLKNWQAEAKVLESDYQRAQKMWDAQLITKEQLEHARYKAESDQWDVKRAHDLLTNAQATARSTELELEKTRIRAPIRWAGSSPLRSRRPEGRPRRSFVLGNRRGPAARQVHLAGAVPGQGKEGPGTGRKPALRFRTFLPGTGDRGKPGGGSRQWHH